MSERKNRLIAKWDRDDVKSEIQSMASLNKEGLLALNNSESFARIITVLVTNECPVMCAHCLAHSGGELRGHAKKETLTRIIHQAREAPAVEAIFLSGGEPFVALEQLSHALQVAKDCRFKTGVLTSANWGTTDDEAREILTPLAPHIDILFVSMDIYHQQRISLDMVRTVLRVVLETGTDVVIINCVAAEEIAKGHLISPDTMTLAKEFSIPFHAQPLLANGRARGQEYMAPTLRADQPCGIISKPIFYPNGEAHACCGGAALFKPGHPFYIGNLQNKSVAEIVSESSRSRVIQGIRTLGPLKMLELINEPSQGFKSQCHACHYFTKRPDVSQRVDDAFALQPDLLDYISEYRRAVGDLTHEGHFDGLVKKINNRH